MQGRDGPFDVPGAVAQFNGRRSRGVMQKRHLADEGSWADFHFPLSLPDQDVTLQHIEETVRQLALYRQGFFFACPPPNTDLHQLAKLTGRQVPKRREQRLFIFRKADMRPVQDDLGQNLQRDGEGHHIPEHFLPGRAWVLGEVIDDVAQDAEEKNSPQLQLVAERHSRHGQQRRRVHQEMGFEGKREHDATDYAAEKGLDAAILGAATNTTETMSVW